VIPNQRTSLWFMCCKFLKWITAVVAVKIKINSDQIQNPQLITVAEILTRDNMYFSVTVTYPGIVWHMSHIFQYNCVITTCLFRRHVLRICVLITHIENFKLKYMHETISTNRRREMCPVRGVTQFRPPICRTRLQSPKFIALFLSTHSYAFRQNANGT
jgi:hypothetical protein